MNIAFLSSIDPTDIHNWSGTLYYMYHNLKVDNHITWIGKDQLDEAIRFHKKNNGEDTTFEPEYYSMLLGKLLSDLLKHEWYELIICRDYFFLAYLITDIPIIYIGDTTFRLFNQYMQLTDSNFVNLADNIEKKAIQKATRLVYSSEWARNSAILDYRANPNKINVIEFGANIYKAPEFHLKKMIQSCNLIFIGREWDRKGGWKLLDIYHIIKSHCIPCTLTIIGSYPKTNINDQNITIYPYIDKSTEEGMTLFQQLLQQSHLLIAPALFECFGILYCEAAAYGIPVLTSNVGGVSQVIREGKNGFLFPVNATAIDYANQIINLYTDKIKYENMQKLSREEFETRLNWQIWKKQMNTLFSQLQEEKHIYIPVYVIDAKERKEQINYEFKNKPEFELNTIDIYTNNKEPIELWNGIVKAIQIAKEKKEDVIIICRDNHHFTNNYSYGLFMKEVYEAYAQGAELLSGGIGACRQAIPIGFHRYWIDYFQHTLFTIIYDSLFDKILAYKFQENDTADNALSILAHNKMVIYPFISEPVSFENSDTIQNHIEENNLIREYFDYAKNQFKTIEQVSKLNNQ
ncbi:glycosyltransferase family 4 protein [Bacteroides fragilis]|jgi:glycosyltransferase involved in cell wall biosynthesis|nr:glycosyltransferase family 4 protein [Bacteroides fragilis]